jgi:guanylate kinase
MIIKLRDEGRNIIMEEVASSEDRIKINSDFQKDRDIIVAIIGKSGSGKSEIVKRYYDKGLNVIQSYTDRPQRYNNEWGHIYINTEEVVKYKEDMIAYTFFDGHHYFATRNQYREKGITFYVIDPRGVVELRDKITDAELKFIYISVDENIRIERMVKRSLEKLINPTEKEVQALYEAVGNRANYDREAFKIIPCDYVVDNNGSLTDTLSSIDSIIQFL